LQAECRAWLDNLPENLKGSRLAEKLPVIASSINRPIRSARLLGDDRGNARGTESLLTPRWREMDSNF
jgi:hypothetical protein